MDIHIENFRGIHDANIACRGITLIAGENAAGKTSIAQAAAAALTGNPLPLYGLKKGEAGQLIHSGSAQGRVTLRTSNGKAVLSWPSSVLQTEGTPPRASLIAAGLESVAAETRTSDRARLLAPYLESDPTEEDLSKALPGFDPGQVTGVWNSIRINGWDLAHKEASTKGTELKGRWHQVSGESYGSKKAASWTPDDWDDRLFQCSEQDLVSNVHQHRAALDEAISRKAVGEADCDALRKVAAMEIDLSALEETVRQAEAHHWEMIKTRNNLPPAIEPGSPLAIACPHCSQPVVVTKKVSDGFVLHKAEELNRQEAKKRGMAIAAAEGKIGNAQNAVWEAKRALDDGRRQSLAAENARKKLEVIENSKNRVSEEQVEDCREQLHQAELQVAAFRIKKEADRLHALIESNQKVINILAPDGIRAIKLAEAIQDFNRNMLQPLCDVAQWPMVTLNDDLAPALGGRLYPLLSESEQFRVRVTLQVALAGMDRSDALVIDRADVLDRPGRNGLIRMLCQTGIPSLVCMTITNPDKTPPPDLASKGKGITYWITGGTATAFDVGQKSP
ncbi:MAG: AAA family ATPase, partial [Magnetococcales bacterium]|nr:AAA family ATPase [Magnetococcales bacterium]